VARPGRDLLDWIGEWSDTGLRWDDDATTLLFAVLTDGDVRAWRFLETTGVLERALPELAEAVRRRRADRSCSIPTRCSALRWWSASARSLRATSWRPSNTQRSRTPVAAAGRADPRHRG
jgi:hypothetical protein